MHRNPFFEENFNTQREQWEKSLLAELKIQEVGNKASKKFLNGTSWPTLSLKAEKVSHVTPMVSWKKAATSYAYLTAPEVETVILEDIDNGVRDFFFFDESLNPEVWSKIETTLLAFPKKEELDIFLLGNKNFPSKLKVITNIISGKRAVTNGGDAIQELALMIKVLIENAVKCDDIYLGVFVDSLFFQNIAKIRAARLLALKVLEELNLTKMIKVVALTNFTGWTLYERYSNMLRNEAAVASAYIAGADHVQSSGYNTIFELESENITHSEHTERSRRMCRNTTHILALESMLGVVEDASYGSFHLENLTEYFCQEAWALMQKLLQGHDLDSDIKKIRDQRLQMLRTRKSVMSGTNDYPDRTEKLKITLKAPELFRVGREFEELRLKVESLKAPEVFVALYGEYGALNARLNFVKNYFELLGLTVLESDHSEFDKELFLKHVLSRKEKIIVLCALDEDYPEILEAAGKISAPLKYIAGKTEMAGFKNLFAGQNVYEVLSQLSQEIVRGEL